MADPVLFLVTVFGKAALADIKDRVIAEPVLSSGFISHHAGAVGMEGIFPTVCQHKVNGALIPGAPLFRRCIPQFGEQQLDLLGMGQVLPAVPG